jgi:hypothetical protein
MTVIAFIGRERSELEHYLLSWVVSI